MREVGSVQLHRRSSQGPAAGEGGDCNSLSSWPSAQPARLNACVSSSCPGFGESIWPRIGPSRSVAPLDHLEDLDQRLHGRQRRRVAGGCSGSTSTRRSLIIPIGTRSPPASTAVASNSPLPETSSSLTTVRKPPRSAFATSGKAFVRSGRTRFRSVCAMQAIPCREFNAFDLSRCRQYPPHEFQLGPVTTGLRSIQSAPMRLGGRPCLHGLYDLDLHLIHALRIQLVHFSEKAFTLRLSRSTISRKRLNEPLAKPRRPSAISMSFGTLASRERTTGDCDRTHRGSPSLAKTPRLSTPLAHRKMWRFSYRLAIRQQDNTLLTVCMRRHLRDVEEATPFSLYVVARMEDVTAVMALLSEVKS